LAADGKSVTTTKVDDAGRFRIEHLAPGDYVFEIITPQGRAEDSDIITVPPLKPRADGTPSPRELALGDIRLAEGVALYVEARSTDGIAIPAASVTVAQKGDPAIKARSFERKADEKGVARFDGLDAGLPIRVACSAPGFAQFNGTLATPTPLATCVLQRFGSIEGTVVDSDGAPVAAATVEILGDTGKRVTADAEGAFSFKELVVGSLRVRASGPGRGSAIREVTVAEGEDADVGKLELANVAAVRGRVVSSVTGEPIAGATVTAVDPPGLTTVTDDGGMFELDCDETVSTTLHVTASGYARARSSLRPTQTDTVHAIRLQRPGALEVTAWDDDGEPCRGCTIVAAGEDDVRSVFANERGLAQFDGLTPGEYHVARERISSTSRQVVVSGGGDTQVGLVTANVTTRLELGSPARALQVRVSPSLPADHALRAYGSSRTLTAARLQADGSFSFPRRRGETYDLRVESRTGGVFVGHITPAFSGDTFSAQLGDATIEIRLTSATTAAGYVVNVLAASGSRAAWARTDGSGIARVLYLQPGTYTVTLGDQLLGTVIARSGGIDVLTATVN
jgi:hypothetical protein